MLVTGQGILTGGMGRILNPTQLVLSDFILDNSGLLETGLNVHLLYRHNYVFCMTYQYNTTSVHCIVVALYLKSISLQQ